MRAPIGLALAISACAPSGPWVDVGVDDRQVCLVNAAGELHCEGLRSPLPRDGTYRQLDGDGGGLDFCALDDRGAVVCSDETTILSRDLPTGAGFTDLHIDPHGDVFTGPDGAWCVGLFVHGPCADVPLLDAAHASNMGLGVTPDGALLGLNTDEGYDDAGAPNQATAVAYDDGMRAFLIATPDGVQAYDETGGWSDLSDQAYVRLDTASYVIECTGIASCTSGHTWCGMDEDGAVTCTNEADAREADGLEGAPDVAFVTFDLGDRVACGLTEAGEPLCWGDHAPRRWRP